MKHCHLSICLSLLLCLCLCGCAEKKTVAIENFGALEYAKRFCDIGPRVSCTQGAAEAARWIENELRVIGYSPITDTFNDPDENGRRRIFRNVIAQYKGSGSKHFLLLSHYDTKGGISDSFIGANDSGSSTALLLALAAWYKRNGSDASITFAFLDGEEAVDNYDAYDGLHGSRRLASQLKRANTTLDGVILLDMIGDQDLKLTIPLNTSPAMLSRLKQAARKVGVEERVTETTVEILDDHQPFMQLGYKAIDLIDFDYGSRPNSNDYWHTDEDTLDKLSDETMNIVGTLVKEMIAL